MTAIGMRPDEARATRPIARNGSVVQRVLLGCGILSSLLYIATDVLGGQRYEGYSFASQAISELMAIGAPSEAFVDPMFITSDALALAFAVGVFRAAGDNLAVRFAAVMLMTYALVGFTGPTLFEMHPRGTGSPGADTPHIIVTGVLVLLTLLAIGFGAFALGRRFRVYSFATLLTMIAFGILSVPHGARLAAGDPTPGFGIIERINVYSSVLWIAVLAIGLLRRSPERGEGSARLASRAAPANGRGMIEGVVAF